MQPPLSSSAPGPPSRVRCRGAASARGGRGSLLTIADVDAELSLRGGAAASPGAGGDGGSLDVRGARVRIDGPIDLSGGGGLDLAGTISVGTQTARPSQHRSTA